MHLGSVLSGLIAAGAAILLSSCGREAEVRYAVTVQLGQEIGSPHGTAVWSLHLAKPLLVSDGGYSAVFRAQAIVIRLDGDRRFVTLLKGKDFDQSTVSMLPEILFGESIVAKFDEGSVDRQDRVKVLAKIADLSNQSVTIDCIRDEQLCPIFAVFEDFNDPTSIRHVNELTSDELIGIPFSSIQFSVKIVDDDVTNSVFAELPWLSTHEGSLLIERSNRPRSQQPFATQITVHDFARGVFE